MKRAGPPVKEILLTVANSIRNAVLSHLNTPLAFTSQNIAHSGDTTFGIDEIAEATLTEAVARSDVPLAHFSEDRGLVPADGAETLLIVDPIDGTRPLLGGLGLGVVSIALCRNKDHPKIGDLEAGLILEINTGNLCYAEDGGILEIEGFSASPKRDAELETMFWCFETVGRPSADLMHYLGDLVDGSGLKGAPFLVHNSAWSLARVAIGHLDAYVDVGRVMLDASPQSISDFQAIAGGRVMGTQPYDIAAAHCILRQAGCPITDANGIPLDDVDLLAIGRDGVLSCVAARNAVLHQQIVDALQK